MHRLDLVIMAITSQVLTPLLFGEAMILDWQAGGLIKAQLCCTSVSAALMGLRVRRPAC
jgi:hypothetical protein